MFNPSPTSSLYARLVDYATACGRGQRLLNVCPTKDNRCAGHRATKELRAGSARLCEGQPLNRTTGLPLPEASTREASEGQSMTPNPTLHFSKVSKLILFSQLLATGRSHSARPHPPADSTFNRRTVGFRSHHRLPTGTQTSHWPQNAT